MKSQEEIWKPIPGWEGFYEISNHKRVRRLSSIIVRQNGSKYTVKGGVLNKFKNKGDYRNWVILRNMGDRQKINVDKAYNMIFCQTQKEQKYYFITYQGEYYSSGTVSIVNSVIDISPLEFIYNLSRKTNSGEHKIYGLAITFYKEITKEEYEKYKDEF